jgi:long-chain fatty acid transport protein
MSTDPRNRNRLLTGLLATTVALSGTSDAHADGWKVQLQGVKALGLAYAGRSIHVNDASTVWFNPAGMTRLKERWTFTSAVPLITYRLDYTDAGSTSALGQTLAGSATVDGGRTSPVPHVYVVRKLTHRVWGGLGFNAPFGLGTDYGEQWVGRYHATASELAVFNFNPAVAIQLSDALSVGVGLDIQRSDARLANMIDFGSLGAANGLPLTPQRHDGRIELRVDDWAVGYDLSLSWSMGPRSRAGVTYRSQTEHVLTGTADFTVPAEAVILTGGGALFVDTRAETVLPMPRELSVSGSHELASNWVFVGDVTWTDWSRFERLIVAFQNPLQPTIEQDARFTDSIRGALGVIYRPANRWELRAGGLYESTPVPDATRTPRLPEVDNYGFAAGLSYRLGNRGELDFSFSHLIPHAAPISLEDPAAGRLQGRVRWQLEIIGASFTLTF